MVNLMLAVGGLWGKIINWLGGFIGNFGLTVIVLTVLIKLLLSPLEIYQKVASKKQMEKQAVIQPQLAKIQKQYANNKEMQNKKTMELYKKENVNVMGNCLGMLINLVITLVVFITLFSSLNSISQHNIKKEYEILQNEYVEVFKNNLIENKPAEAVSVVFGQNDIDTINEFVLEVEKAFKGSMSPEEWNASNEKTTFESYLTTAQNAARKAVSTKYGEIKEGFLWIKNVYRPDTWNSVFPTSGEYLSISNTNFKKVDEVPYTDIFGVVYTSEAEAKEAFILSFNEVTTDIQKDYSGWNGWLILVILAAGITLLSQIITAMGNKPKKQYDKKGNEIPVQNPANNKFLLILLPILMVVFTIQYSSAFALYIVVNSAMSTLIGFATTIVMNKIEKNKQLKSEENKVIKNTKGV